MTSILSNTTINTDGITLFVFDKIIVHTEHSINYYRRHSNLKYLFSFLTIYNLQGFLLKQI